MTQYSVTWSTHGGTPEKRIRVRLTAPDIVGRCQSRSDDAGGVQPRRDQTPLDRAEKHGATTVTPPTPFYGEITLARMIDRWQNIWWLWAAAPGQPDPTPAWESGSDTVFATLDSTLRKLAS